MSVLGPNDPRGVVRKATAADKAYVDAVRPASLPNAEAVILGTGEVGFKVVRGSKEEDSLFAEMAREFEARYGNVVPARPRSRRRARRMVP